LKRFLPRTLIAILLALISSPSVFAQEGMNVKFSPEVGATIKLVHIEAAEPVGGFRFVKFTYEAVKSCSKITVYGNNYSKDDVQLSSVSLKAFDAKSGKKFREDVQVKYEPGHYLVLDKAYCL
jgi:hypothetical protein